MKGYKTFIFNVIVAVLPALDFVLASGSHLEAIIKDQKTLAGILLGVGLVNVILRSITTSPIFKKPK
jgi:hypothetical protein